MQNIIYRSTTLDRIWSSSDKRKYMICDLENGHLSNCINYKTKQIIENENSKKDDRNYDVLLTLLHEAERRNFDVLQVGKTEIPFLLNDNYYLFDFKTKRPVLSSKIDYDRLKDFYKPENLWIPVISTETNTSKNLKNDRNNSYDKLNDLLLSKNTKKADIYLKIIDDIKNEDPNDFRIFYYWQEIIAENNHEIFNILLEKAYLFNRSVHGETIFHLAIAYKNNHFIEKILQKEPKLYSHLFWYYLSSDDIDIAFAKGRNKHSIKEKQRLEHLFSLLNPFQEGIDLLKINRKDLNLIIESPVNYHQVAKKFILKNLELV